LHWFVDVLVHLMSTFLPIFQASVARHTYVYDVSHEAP